MVKMESRLWEMANKLWKMALVANLKESGRYCFGLGEGIFCSLVRPVRLTGE